MKDQNPNIQLDMTDTQEATEELIRLLREYRERKNIEPWKSSDSQIDVLSLGESLESFEDLWSKELELILPRKKLHLYHVCRQDQENRILTYGIYHDLRPTLTPSLVGAISQAETYQHIGRPASILACTVPKDRLEFRWIDNMGPGFLPLEERTIVQIPNSALPLHWTQHIFIKIGLKTARWLEPSYFDGAIYRTSDKTMKHLLDSVYNPSSDGKEERK